MDAPERYPLPVLLDAVGLDLAPTGAGLAGADGERAVRDHAVTPVVKVFRAPERLALRKLDHRGKQVLMKLERILAVDDGAKGDRAIGDLHQRCPGRRTQRWPGRIPPTFGDPGIALRTGAPHPVPAP